jgi:hypothetical protein
MLILPCKESEVTIYEPAGRVEFPTWKVKGTVTVARSSWAEALT